MFAQKFACVLHFDCVVFVQNYRKGGGYDEQTLPESHFDTSCNVFAGGHTCSIQWLVLMTVEYHIFLSRIKM